MYDDKRASAFGKISFFLKEPIEIPELQKNESIADVAGTLSHGINFKGSFEKAQNSQVKYRFAHATRDSVDVLQMGVELIGKELKEDHPIYQEDYR